MQIHRENLAPLIMTDEELVRKVAALRELGQKIVLVQGVWDMVHTGHVRYIAKAKSHGDILIVGVDSDVLTRFRKGPKKPFDPQEERLCIIQSLRCVDFVVLRDGDPADKMDTLRLVRPDVFVISETTGAEVQDDIEKFKEFAGHVQNYPQQSSTTTTAKFRRLEGGVLDDFMFEINGVVTKLRQKIDGEAPK